MVLINEKILMNGFIVLKHKTVDRIRFGFKIEKQGGNYKLNFFNARFLIAGDKYFINNKFFIKI